jgi:hypothetical protein
MVKKFLIHFMFCILLTGIGFVSPSSVLADSTDEEGAVVIQDAFCRIPRNRFGPGLPPSALITNSGHLVITPQGNIHLVCHFDTFEGAEETVVAHDFPCFVNGTMSTGSHVVLTKSGKAHLVCHVN